MMNEKVNGKIKDIEKEIDSAIDQLFVDNTSPQRPASDLLKATEESISEREETEPSQVSIKEKVEKEEDSLLQKIKTLQSKVGAFTEWGVTHAALERVSSGVKEISGAFSENRLVESVTRMISEVLDFLEKNPESHIQEMVDFLLSALNSIKMLVRPEKEGGLDPEDIFNSINSQFSQISSLLTLDVQKIELEENFSMPGVPEEGEETPGGKTEGNAEVEEETGEELVGKKPEEEKPLEGKDKTASLEMGFVAPSKAAEEELEMEEIEVLKEEGALEKAEEIHEEKGILMPGYEESTPVYKSFHEITDELSVALKRMERDFFESNSILGLTEKLSIEIDTLYTLSNRFMAVISKGIPSENNLKQVQKAVSEIRKDFKILSNFLGPEELGKFKVEEIVPVVAGKSMIGLLSHSIGNIYSISKRQEQKFRKERHVKINDEIIPLVDLLEELGEMSENPNKRLIVVNAPQGKKAVLADKVLKRRFALISESKAHDSLKIARFFSTEEILVYETL